MEKKSKNTCDNYLIYVEDILKLISFNSSDTIIRRHINTNTYSYIYAFTITCSEKMAEKPIDALSEKVNHKLPFFMNYKPSCFRCTSVYSVKKHKEKTCWMKTTQVEDYGHWILQERSGNVAGSCRKAPEIARSGSSIPTGNLLDFFRWIPVNFLCFPAGTGRKSSEKIRKISGGNTASTFQRFPVLSCRNRPVIFDLGI